MTIDTSQVGIEAAKLMDDLAEEGLPDDAEILSVGLAIEVSYADGDPENPMRHVFTRCSTGDRLQQVGLFESAKYVALTSEDDD